MRLVAEVDTEMNGTGVDCNCPSESTPNLVPVGISLMIVTAVLINLGNNIQVCEMCNPHYNATLCDDAHQ